MSNSNSVSKALSLFLSCINAKDQGLTDLSDDYVREQITSQFAEELRGLSQQKEFIRDTAQVLFNGKDPNVKSAPIMLFAALPENTYNKQDLIGACEEYLSENTGEYGEALFGIRKGAKGGTFLWARKSEDSPEVVDSIARKGAR